MKLLVKNGYMYDENGQGQIKDILIENGTIIKIENNIDSDSIEVVDLKQNLVLPGLIDMHCNICDPGFENKENIITASRSAAKGGFTSITCQPCTNPITDNKTVVNYINTTNQRLSIVNIYPYGSMSKGCNGEEIAEIGEMKKAGVVAVSDGNVSISNADLLKNIMLYSKMFDMPVITFCDDKSLSRVGTMNRGRVSTMIGLRGIPREAEEIIAARNIILAKYAKAKLHITHVSTRGTVELIRRAKKDGVSVTCDTCPQYFTLSEDAVEGYNALAKVNPPLRTSDDIEAIIEGLMDGTIDVISSGHSPTTLESKQLEFDKAAYGISSLETTFPLSYTHLVLTKKLSMEQLMDKLSAAPARILNLEQKGLLQVGYDADLFIVQREGAYKIDVTQFASKAKFSPHHGQTVSGRILYTIVNGSFVYLGE